MGFPRCSSIAFPDLEETELYNALIDISDVYYEFLIYFIFYVGPILVLMNFFAIFILTRKEIRTPYTIIFISMALDQSVAILGHDILLLNTFLEIDYVITTSFAYQVFELAHANLSPMCSAHATWLAVIITFVRLKHLCSGTGEPSLRFIIVLCSISFVIVFLVGIPRFLFNDLYWDCFNVTSEDDGEEWVTKPVFIVADSDRVSDNDCLLLRITYISSGVLYSAIPCILLMVLSVALTYQLRKIRKVHADLISTSKSSVVKAEFARTSWMIAMIVFNTLITGIPQAIVNILVGFMSDVEESSVSSNLSALLVTLVILSSAINLIIYLCMSRSIREVTMSYLCCVCRKIKTKKTTRSPILPTTSNNFTSAISAIA